MSLGAADNLSRSTGRPFEVLLVHLELERLFYRMTRTAHADGVGFQRRNVDFDQTPVSGLTPYYLIRASRLSGFPVHPTSVRTLTSGSGVDIYVLSNRTILSGRLILKPSFREHIVPTDEEYPDERRHYHD